MNKKLLKEIRDHFNNESSELISKMEQNYNTLLPMTESESKDRAKNMRESVLPFIALYQALQSEGIDKETAMKHMFAITESFTRHGMRRTYEKAGKLPFFFSLFRKMFSTGLKGKSWEVEWVSNNSETFEYNIKKCLWHETCMKAGCPELCVIFCHNDDINFTDVSPHLYFRRNTTLGEGGDCCDFHFYSHEPKSEK